MLAYQWPVYQWRVGDPISAALAPAPNVVVAWRYQMDQVRVEPVQPIAAVLLEWLSAATTGLTVQVFSDDLQQTLPHLSPDQIEGWVQHVLDWLQQQHLLTQYRV